MLDFGFYNMDCMDGMQQFPDKYFDIAIVDPPYFKDVARSNYFGKEISQTNVRRLSHHSEHWNPYDSYGEICVGCGCCSKYPVKRANARYYVISKQLKHLEKFDYWSEDTDTRKIQEKNVKSNIKYFKKKLRYYKKGLRN